ncbi:hypothetical protein L6164_032372 [Bauhinia variegata]|uniref:Uncharacterized protein n=1 Tax=Bauhinia variegata TaxID=167791 RepID=A0ACB9KNM4_BAUVA|nr:hypothetical protein L6164_032372 [Bauhinia variegata]
MEKVKTKRARDGDDETEIRSSESSSTNKRDPKGVISMSMKEKKKKKDVEEKGSRKWDSHLAMGVFDFPWLKDGVIAKPEELNLDFEDKFSSCLERQYGAFEADDLPFSEANGFCETPESSMASFPGANLVENVCQPFERDGLELKAEDVDCIWSSLLNEPLYIFNNSNYNMG